MGVVEQWQRTVTLGSIFFPTWDVEAPFCAAAKFQCCTVLRGLGRAQAVVGAEVKRGNREEWEIGWTEKPHDADMFCAKVPSLRLGTQCLSGPVHRSRSSSQGL